MIDYATLAYIDPGVGSLLLQVVLAAMLSMGVMFRRTVLAPFQFLFGKPHTDDDAESTDQPSED